MMSKQELLCYCGVSSSYFCHWKCDENVIIRLAQLVYVLLNYSFCQLLSFPSLILFICFFLMLFRFYRRGDRSFRKAEKQRLKAEKRLLKAEVKEIRKQLRMERRGIQWNSSQRDGSSSPVLLQPQATQHNSPEYLHNNTLLHITSLE